jgi:hypothetical protein
MVDGVVRVDDVERVTKHVPVDEDAEVPQVTAR